MDEDHLAPAWENQVWLARQLSAMKPEPVAHRMDKTANNHFRGCVFAPHAGHRPTAVFRRLRGAAHVLSISATFIIRVGLASNWLLA
ncbi:hypothetical protein GGR34_003305 [Microvirga flocculans]|uniref:Uncharacterized protein n=1 Tax=Microvirga flocculans TaxID=217168 RepID=A0A7W6N9C5_9HYPH|nr:hypothetical protein [Microvirga flocculans]